ncbi:MAG TPA: hypothetical protein VMF59_02085 [Bacteroidota bacterium]|nr:hypothetical protein [Bacteroidota bacterium]
MKTKWLWLSGFIVASLIAIAPAADAQVWVGLRTGPPPPRREVVVVRPGYAWVHGFWGWDHARYVWRPGRYVVARPGHYWVDGGWRHRHDGWAYREGHWRRR